jgi:carbonic anhydrase/acetyltransferase-like protein (isoleucine patch superfamily)
MTNIFEFNGYKPVIDRSAFIHPNATVTGNVIIGKHVYIGPGAAIRGDWGQIVRKLHYSHVSWHNGAIKGGRSHWPRRYHTRCHHW